jgi:hypothetical protein
MKLEVIQLKMQKTEILTAEYIEKIFAEKNYSPLRWAVTKIINNELIIDAVVITNQ